MDGLRTHARDEFGTEQQFTPRTTCRQQGRFWMVHVAKFPNAEATVDVGDYSLSHSNSMLDLVNKPTDQNDNETATARLTLIQFERRWDDVVCMDKDTFMAVFADFDLDPYWLHMIHRSVYGFFSQCRRSERLYNCYLHTVSYTALWSHNVETSRTKVLFIPKNGSHYPELGFNSLLKTIKHQKELVDDRRFFSFVCGIQLARHLEVTVRANLSSIRDTEDITGYGIWSGCRSGSVATTDELVTNSKRLGLALTALANVFRHGCIGRALLKDLSSRQSLCLHRAACLHSSGRTSHTPTVDGIACARDMIESQIQSSELEASYLQERGRTQQSVIFNLLARDDAKRSKDIALAAQKDSYSMKTIAIMTMIFLPPTFFATLFAMPLLKWDEPKVMQRNFGLYWAFSMPTTALVLLFWHWMSADKMIFAIVWTWIVGEKTTEIRRDIEEG
ncbi:hypothetical protein G6011_08097 [Alternaria panax]|uniref:Uncharacterized protein n=1 Tax=Alternaria panax TaxID=48097 RepID=A0AAD4FM13_9PLEO|nr:hypothetical protein G6011_08097 [Alternaria panax]